MITLLISIVCLVVGYLIYGKFVEKVVGPDPGAKTPAYTKQDGIDYIPMPTWKVFMIQFLNIAGTGPIFGAIMGAMFGPSCYLWIVLGCIFGGAVHDYFTGMLSIRGGGENVPSIVGRELGGGTKKVMLVFSVVMLILVSKVPWVLLATSCSLAIPTRATGVLTVLPLEAVITPMVSIGQTPRQAMKPLTVVSCSLQAPSL